MTQAWQTTIKKLLEHGQSTVLAQPDAERGADAPYEVIIERDAAGYIPLGMELTIDGRRMKIDSVNYDTGKVSLQDLEIKGWYPIFRSEPVSFVRSFVEEVQQSKEYIAAEVAKAKREENERESSTAKAEAPAVPAPAEPEQVEIAGGQITAPPPKQEQEIRHKTVAVYRGGGLPFDVEIQTLGSSITLW